MKKILSVCILLVSTLASAGSKMEVIRDLYDQGAQPNMVLLTYLVSGRCFNSTNPDKPYGSAFALQREEDTSSGPAFPPEFAYKFIFAGDPDKEPTYYDTRDPYYLLDDAVTVEPKIEQTQVVIEKVFSYPLNIRTNGDYVVTMFQEGAVLTYCYYFKSIAMNAIPPLVRL